MLPHAAAALRPARGAQPRIERAREGPELVALLWLDLEVLHPVAQPMFRQLYVNQTERELGPGDHGGTLRWKLADQKRQRADVVLVGMGHDNGPQRVHSVHHVLVV